MPLWDTRHLNEVNPRTQKTIWMVYESQERAIMYEYAKGDNFRCRQMIMGALSSTSLPHEFSATYQAMIVLLDERKGNNGGKDPNPVQDLIDSKLRAYKYTLETDDNDGEDNDSTITVTQKAVSLQHVTEEAKKYREQDKAFKESMFQKLLSISIEGNVGGSEMQEGFAGGRGYGGRPGHTRSSSF